VVCRKNHTHPDDGVSQQPLDQSQIRQQQWIRKVRISRKGVFVHMAGGSCYISGVGGIGMHINNIGMHSNRVGFAI
jgi:hypothetical protein